MRPAAASRDVVAGLVLAAGASVRMPGTTKLLRRWGEGVVIDAVVTAARLSDLAPICVVVGADALRIEQRLEGTGVIAVTCEDWDLGRSSTLAAGLAALREISDARAALILLGDEPGIREEAIRSVVSSWRACSTGIVRARYTDRPGHPVLIAREGWALAIETAALRDESRSTWERLISLGLDAREIEIDGPAPIDVDDPGSLKRAQLRCARDAVRPRSRESP